MVGWLDGRAGCLIVLLVSLKFTSDLLVEVLLPRPDFLAPSLSPSFVEEHSMEVSPPS